MNWYVIEEENRKKWVELGFGTREANCFRNNGVKELSDLSQLTEREMLRWPNFGRKSLNLVKEIMASHGISPKQQTVPSPEKQLAGLYAKLGGHMNEVASLRKQIAEIEAVLGLDE